MYRYVYLVWHVSRGILKTDIYSRIFVWYWCLCQNTFLGQHLIIYILYNYVHPCEKVIGIFFQNQIWSRLLDINRLCLICIKRSIEEVKMCQIYKRGYQKGPSDETLKKARYQFCDVKFGHRITVVMGLFDYKMCNLPQFPLISQTGEARVLFHDLLVLFCINDIFVNYTQLK